MGLGVPFVVGGVIEREQDFASQRAYTVGQGLYMSYDAYVSLTGNEQAITCYELVMPEPVKGFALDTVKTNFTLGRGEALRQGAGTPLVMAVASTFLQPC